MGKLVILILVAILQDIAATGSQKNVQISLKEIVQISLKEFVQISLKKSCSDFSEQFFFQRNLNKIFFKEI